MSPLPAASTLRISVIMPVHNGGPYLERTIPALRASSHPNVELIVVDDASTDITPELLRRLRPDVHIVNATQQGPFASRNLAAARASGEILFFTDADVLVPQDTLARVASRLRAPEAGAVIGLYCAPDEQDNLWMFYKTAWIRFSYLQAPTRATWFFTAVGALRREAWEACGPFHTGFSIKTGGGDIDYGRRLVARGTDIELDRTLEVRHLKHFSLASLLRNDLLRAFGYCRLALRRWRFGATSSAPPRKGIANVGSSFVAGTVMAPIVALTLAAGWPTYSTVALLGVWLAINRRFLVYVRSLASAGRALSLVPLLWLDQLACALGVAGALSLEVVDRCFPGSGRADPRE